tara:strand:- start:496 stop:1158 length:663 start_codon:yes stop_codon:yes gene_type:complete
MSGIATAIAVGAGATLYAGSKASKASKEAAAIQESGTQSGMEEQRRQFDVTQENLKPFQDAGVSAIEQQQILLGLGGSSSTATPQEQQRAAFDEFNESPGQRFMRDRAQKNLLRNASAIGGLGGGNVRSALVQQGVGFAQQDYGNQFSRLGQLAGQGQAATVSGGQFGANSANNIAGLNIAGSEARASGILGAAQARSDTAGQLAGLGGLAINKFVPRTL